MNLEDLKKHKPLYVIGHKNPDFDTVVSSYLLAKILNSFGIVAEAVMLKDDYTYDKFSVAMIRDFVGYEFKKLENLNGYFLLVDHNDPLQSVGDAKVLASFDHHQNVGKISNVLYGDYASTSLFIYDYFKDKYSFSNEERVQIYMATLDDTLFFRSSRYKAKDRQLLEGMNLNLDSEFLFEKYFVSTDLSNGVKSAFLSQVKEHSYKDIKFNSSTIKTVAAFDKLRDEYVNLINDESYFLGMWLVVDKGISYAYFKSPKCVKIKEYNYIASRANDVLPDMIEFLRKED